MPPELKALVAEWSDDEIWNLNRGGHDPHKIYAARSRKRFEFEGQADRFILAKTIRGYGTGEACHDHEHHPPAEEDAGGAAEEIPRPVPSRRSPTKISSTCRTSSSKKVRRNSSTCAPAARTSAAICRRVARRPSRSRCRNCRHSEPAVEGHGRRPRGSPRRWRSCGSELHHPAEGQGVGQARRCRSLPDESRTFGVEGLFRRDRHLQIQELARSTMPEDSDQLMFYRESENRSDPPGRHQRSAAAWPTGSQPRRRTRRTAKPSARSPFYIYYSMFGFQRMGDLAGGAGDMRSRGFLRGAPGGPTTLNGEGLHLEDGHCSPLWPLRCRTLHQLRPDVRCHRTGGHHAGRSAPHEWPSRKTSSTTSPS